MAVTIKAMAVAPSIKDKNNVVTIDTDMANNNEVNRELNNIFI